MTEQIINPFDFEITSNCMTCENTSQNSTITEVVYRHNRNLFYCEHCLETLLDNSTVRTCSQCEEIYYPQIRLACSETTCENCHDSNHVVCEDCERCLETSETFIYNDSIYCEDCYYSNFTQCHRCDEYESNDEIVYTEQGYYVCSNCFSIAYFTCETCNGVFSDEYYANNGMCEQCYENDRGNMHGYNYKPNPRFHGNEKHYLETLFFGIELEIEFNGNSKDDFQNSIDELSDNESLFYAKHDSSLNDGFEIVSHPCTFEFHKFKFPWKQLLETYSNAGYRSHDTGTCGIHVHMSKTCISDVDQLKFAYFVNSQDEIIKTVCRRGNNHYCEKKYLSMSKEMLRCQHSRYDNVNFSNTETFEFRQPKGTLKLESFLAILEFCESLIKFLHSYNLEHLSVLALAKDDYLKHVRINKERYNNLFNLFIERGLLEDRGN